MVRDILLLGHPQLAMKCEQVMDVASPHVQETITDLDDTLLAFRRSTGWGRGIAGPQIGVLLRIVVLRAPRRSVLVNPVIVESTGSQLVWDDCFSIPGIVMRVSRAEAVRVTYEDEQGRPQALSARGSLAELLQHEIDHLNGILALHRVQDLSDIMAQEEWRRQQLDRL